MDNRYAKTSELRLEISRKNDTSILSDVYFTPPFKIMKPFYERGFMKILQMSASPGIMEGDYQKINISVKNGSAAEIYSQSFEKIHKMEMGYAVREINISIEDNSLFIYNPLPVIPYKDSAFKNKIIINLKDSTSVFVYSDILSAGRIARNELFQFKFYNSFMEIFENNELKFRDNTRFYPQKMNIRGIGMYEGYKYLLNMVICNINIEEKIYLFLSTYNIMWGISKNENGYVIIKILGNNSEILQEICNKIKSIALETYKN